MKPLPGLGFPPWTDPRITGNQLASAGLPDDFLGMGDSAQEELAYALESVGYPDDHEQAAKNTAEP